MKKLRKGAYVCELWGMRESHRKNNGLDLPKLKTQRYHAPDGTFTKDEDGYLESQDYDKVLEAYLEVEKALLIYGGKLQQAVRAFLVARHAEHLKPDQLVNLIWIERRKLLHRYEMNVDQAIDKVYDKIEEKYKEKK